MSVWEMIWVAPLPDQMASTAYEAYRGRVEVAPTVRPMMGIQIVRIPTDHTLAAIALVNMVAEFLPSIRFNQCIVVHRTIYARPAESRKSFENNPGHIRGAPTIGRRGTPRSREPACPPFLPASRTIPAQTTKIPACAELSPVNTLGSGVPFRQRQCRTRPIRRDHVINQPLHVHATIPASATAL